MESVAKQRRSVIKRQKRTAEKEAKQKLGTVAKLNDVPTSTRKMRLVAALIRGKKVNHALSILKFQAKSGAPRLEKLLLTAIADWQAKNPDARLEEADLLVKEIFVDGGKILKRLRPAPQGRAHRVRKRSNHVTLLVGSLTDKATPTAEAPKAEEGKKASKAKAPAAKTEKKTTKKTDNK